MSKNLYQDKKWKEMRAKFLKRKCEICGSIDRLSLHHKLKCWEFDQIIVILAKRHVLGDDSAPFTIENILRVDLYRKEHYQELRQEALLVSDEQRNWYFSGKDTVTLCMSCHWKVEHGRLKIGQGLYE